MPSLLASQSPYGIICREKQNGSWVAVAVAASFSDDAESVSILAEKCTALQLSPDHLLDVVSDFITQSALNS